MEANPPRVANQNASLDNTRLPSYDKGGETIFLLPVRKNGEITSQACQN